MVGSYLWRGYVQAGETYLLCSLFAPVRELAGGCSRKQDDETSATTTRYATTLVASHRPVISHHTDQTNNNNCKNHLSLFIFRDSLLTVNQSFINQHLFV